MKSLTAILPLGLLVTLGGLVVADHHKQKNEKEEKILAALPEKASAEPKEKRKLLVFSRTNGFRHKSIETGKIALKHLGEKTGAYEAIISDDLSNFEADNISDFDAICFLSTTQEVFSPSKKELEVMSDDEKAKAAAYSDELKASLMSFIKGGKGFVGIHAATDTFYKWPEYGEMINGYFAGHPWNAGTEVTIKIEEGMEKHPLTEMFDGESLVFKEEIYQLKKPYDSSKVDMLLRLDTEKSPMDLKGINRKDNDFGVAWSRSWGDGRVFYCSLGHNHHIFWNEKVLQHFLAGIQYATGDLEIPSGK